MHVKKTTSLRDASSRDDNIKFKLLKKKLPDALRVGLHNNRFEKTVKYKINLKKWFNESKKKIPFVFILKKFSHVLTYYSFSLITECFHFLDFI